MRKVIAVATYELIHIMRDSKLRLAISLLPLLFAFLFGAVYSEKVLREIPTAVLDQDNTALSREIITAFDTSEKFQVVCYVDDYKSLKRLIDQGQVKVGLVIPHDLAKNILEGNPQQVLTVYDASNLIYANNIKKNAMAITLTLSGQLGAKMLAAGGMLTDRAIQIINAVDYRSEVWYNPTYNYINYLYLGLLLLIVHQITAMCACVSFTREKESGGFLQFALSPVSKLEIMVGKGIPYFLMGMFNFSLLLLLAHEALALPVNGNLLLLFLLVAVMLAAVVGLAFCLSLSCDNSVLPTRLVSATSIPLFLASGFVWPLEAMPPVIRWIMYSQPLTWTLQAARYIAAKGAGFQVVWPYFLILGALCMLLWAGAYAVLIFTGHAGLRKVWPKARTGQEMAAMEQMAG